MTHVKISRGFRASPRRTPKSLPKCASGESSARFEADFQSGWQALEAEWKTTIQPLYEKIRAANAGGGKLFPGLGSGVVEETGRRRANSRTPRNSGGWKWTWRSLPEHCRRTSGWRCPARRHFPCRLSLAYPLEGSILFETAKGGEAEAVAAINNIIFRLLSTTPPGKLSFTIFDPVGLGQNFAALMHLADYEESTINSRIWTQTAQFEEKLAELNEHMEKIIQMYLRNEYATIAEYNAQAGSIAEKYHFLVIASFPVNFSDTAARRLRNIAANGARCGVYTLIHWDQRNAPPNGFCARRTAEK